jgi:CRISPR/Cas system CMR-associated protein Cmr3 (group 5 of RAMP superfamily)
VNEVRVDIPVEKIMKKERIVENPVEIEKIVEQERIVYKVNFLHSSVQFQS